jgi:hypothetical protein
MYVVELSAEAQADMRAIRAFHRPGVYRALADLSHQAEVETRHRKPLLEPLEDLPQATWEIRAGDYRAFYVIRSGEEQTVRVLRVILKGTATTLEALNKARMR